MTRLSALFVLIALAVVTIPHAFVLAQYTGEQKVLHGQGLDQNFRAPFKKYERLRLDAKSAADEVRKSGRLSLATSGARFDLRLTPHDLRAPGYTSLKFTDRGAERMSKAPVNTYRGVVEGLAKTEARFTVDNERVEGVIITPQELYYVEPLSPYSAAASASDYIMYKASDVTADENAASVMTLNHKVNRALGNVRSTTPMLMPQTSTTLREVELATEADNEYVVAQGGAAAANSEILGIMNQVDGIYRREVGLTFRVVFQSAWDTANDPYSATDLVAILNEFTNYWNTNRTSVPRDLAHMWTGKDSGGLGVSWQGTVCLKPNFSYGVSPLIRDTPQKYIITAHELGHSFNATHPTDSACNNTIMSTLAGPTTQQSFCQQSRNEITSFVNANSGCLTTQPSTGTWIPATISQVELQTWTINGITYAKVKLNFPHAGHRVTNWGQVTRSGNSFTIDASVEQFTGTSVQAVVTIAQIYELGALVPGTYNFTYKTSGVTSLSRQFTVSNQTPPPNPIDDTTFFVSQQYRDFLAREPDAPGLAFWSDNINKCNDSTRRPAGQTAAQCIDIQRTTTSAAFFLSPEFQYTGYYVYRIYKGSLGRKPFYSEFSADQRFVANNIIVNNQLSGTAIEQNKRSFAELFVNRQEFNSIYGALSNTQYVDKLFETTGIAPTTAERQALIDGLNAGTETRATVLQKIVDGIQVIAEGNQQFTTRYGKAFYDKEFNNAFVQMEYFGYMKRDPDDAGYNFWLGKLNSFNGDYIKAEMVRSFIVSPEYRARFGQP